MKICLYNAKGGTAKTTSCVNLAHALALKKLKVLLIDCDPQASAAFHFGISRDNLSPSLANVLLDGLPSQKAIRSTGAENLSIITGSLALAGFDIRFANEKGREHRLRDTIASLKDFDMILMDAAPTMGLLALNVLSASDHIIVPTPPNYLSLQGLKTLEESLALIKKGMGVTPNILGILATQVDRRAKSTDEALSLLQKHYSGRLFKTTIPTNSKLAEAPSFGKTIFGHDKGSRGAKAYEELAEEVLKRLKNKGK